MPEPKYIAGPTMLPTEVTQRTHARLKATGPGNTVQRLLTLEKNCPGLNTGRANFAGQTPLAHQTDTHAGTIRTQLRAQTHNVHEQLHQHSHFVALFNGTISPAQYRALIMKFHGFYVPLERAVDSAMAQSASTLGGFRYTNRAALLKQDMADLGFDASEIESNPLFPQMAEFITPASLGGVLYVIEGSTLGAAQIDRAAQKILPQDTARGSARGRNFWAWSRASNKSCWGAINGYLDHLERAGHSNTALIKGAQDTFQALASWIAPLDPAAQSQGFAT